MAVADGAGSAKYSREGSRIACETVVEHCKNALIDCQDFEDAIKAYSEDEAQLRVVRDFSYKILGNAALKAFNAIKKEAERKEGAKIKDYATTLLLSICLVGLLLLFGLVMEQCVYITLTNTQQICLECLMRESLQVKLDS